MVTQRPTKRSKPSHAPRPSSSRAAAAPSDSDSEDEEDAGSEEDEWANERTHKQQSTSRRQYADEDDDSYEARANGIAQFDDEEDYEEEEEMDEEAILGKQLSSIPFGSLLKAKKKLARSEAQADDDGEEDQEETTESARYSRNGAGQRDLSLRPGQKKRSNGSMTKADRASKHAPMEMSSKRAVGRSRIIVETQADRSRDPRFDSLSGNFKPDLFKTSYSFLSTAQTTELEALRKTASLARKNLILPEEEKARIEGALNRMESRQVAVRTKEREGEALRNWMKEEVKKRGEGKKEFYLKKGDQREVILKAKYDTLSKDKKQLRKTVEKKRRKEGQKEKKKMPEKRGRS